MAASTSPRTPAPERPPPPVPVSTPPPPLETPPSPSPSSQPGEEYHTPPPSLDASPRAEASFHSDGRGGGGGGGLAPEQSPPSSHDASPREDATLPTKSLSLDASPRAEDATSPSDGRGREAHTTKNLSLAASPREQGSLPGDARGGRAAPAKSPTLSPVRLPPPPPVSPSGQNGKGGGGVAAAGGKNAAAQGRPQLRLVTSLVRTPSQGSLATKSPSPSPSPTPPSPLTPATPPVVNSNNKSTQTTPKLAEARKARPSPGALGTTVEQSVDPDEEAATSPLRLGKAGLELDHQQHQQQQQRRQQHAGASENGGDVPPDVAAVAAVGERRALSVTLRLATAVLSLAAFSVIASARTTGWAGDSYARHQQYRYAVAVNVIVCAYSIAQSFGEIRRLISPTFIFRSMSSYYCSLFLDQVLAYLLMSASSAAASRNDLWVSRFGTDAFNRKISSALWLSFIGFLMLSLNALISTANLFSMI